MCSLLGLQQPGTEQHHYHLADSLTQPREPTGVFVWIYQPAYHLSDPLVYADVYSLFIMSSLSSLVPLTKTTEGYLLQLYLFYHPLKRLKCSKAAVTF